MGQGSDFLIILATIIGLIVFIAGTYYCVKFWSSCKAHRDRNKDEVYTTGDKLNEKVPNLEYDPYFQEDADEQAVTLTNG